MPGSDTYSLSSANIVHETFEDEVVVANLESGTYYAMRREAADIWRGAVQGASGDEIAAALSQRYVGDPATILSEVSRFLQRLEAEGLLRAKARAPGDGGVSPSMAAAKVPAVFSSPVMEIHRDLQDLLLLDPIHEVGPEGWPARKP